MLEFGDRIGLLANRKDLPGLRRLLGDSIGGTAEFSSISSGIGMALGFLIGAIQIPLPGIGELAIGLAGVPIMALILQQSGDPRLLEQARTDGPAGYPLRHDLARYDDRDDALRWHRPGIFLTADSIQTVITIGKRADPRTGSRRNRMERQHVKYQRLIDACKTLPPTPTAVAHPCDESSLAGAVDAAKLGLIAPILVGPRARIEAVAKEHGIDIAGLQIVDAPHSHAAAERAVALVREGKAEALMKGSLHTDELMGAVVQRDTGLRTARRVSHCFVMDVPSYAETLIVTDAAVNIAPTLEGQGRHHPERDRPRARAAFPGGARRDPVGDGDGQPRRAFDDRGRARCARWPIAGRSRAPSSTGRSRSTTRSASESVAIKKIDSPVAGRANVLVVPDLEAGNMLAKSLSFLAGADAAGIVLGAKVPIILTSRADSVMSRLASCAVAVMVANARRESAAKAMGLTMAEVIAVLNAGSSVSSSRYSEDGRKAANGDA